MCPTILRIIAATCVLAAGLRCAESPSRSVRLDAREPPDIRFRAGEYFVILLSVGPNWDPHRPRDEQAGITAHRQYLNALLRNGTVSFGGPFVDDLGGLAVLRAGSLDEARRIAGDDPAVRTGVLRAEVHRWRVLPGPPAGR